VIDRLRPLRDVQVKAGVNGSRSYAALGQTVALQRNTQGRIDVVGPGDTIVGTGNLKKYNLGDPTPVSTTVVGLETETLPYDHLKGPTPGVPGTSLYSDGVTPYKVVRVIDGAGNPV
jgi:hypothetical protein